MDVMPLYPLFDMARPYQFPYLHHHTAGSHGFLSAWWGSPAMVFAMISRRFLAIWHVKRAFRRLDGACSDMLGGPNVHSAWWSQTVWTFWKILDKDDPRIAAIFGMGWQWSHWNSFDVETTIRILICCPWRGTNDGNEKDRDGARVPKMLKWFLFHKVRFARLFEVSPIFNFHGTSGVVLTVSYMVSRCFLRVSCLRIATWEGWQQLQIFGEALQRYSAIFEATVPEGKAQKKCGNDMARVMSCLRWSPENPVLSHGQSVIPPLGSWHRVA